METSPPTDMSASTEESAPTDNGHGHGCTCGHHLTEMKRKSNFFAPSAKKNKLMVHYVSKNSD